jgi:hypothetical protein
MGKRFFKKRKRKLGFTNFFSYICRTNEEKLSDSKII